MARREIIGRERPQVVAVGAKVIVDHIQDDAESGGMGALDEEPHVIRPSIEAGGRKQIHAIVAPAEAARKISDGHKLDYGDA